MTTYIYGGSPADVVTDTDGNVLAGIELQVYATASSLAPVAGLAQKTGDTYKPVYRLKTDTEGRYQFTSGAGPTLWIETASSGKRWRIEAWQTTTEKLADLLNIKTVTRTLTPGSTANVQVAATANDLTFNFAIPTGTQGPRGLKGEPGKDGPDEDAIAEYFRRAASRPMQALAELGVPRPYASKTAIDATRGSSVGELARDVSSRVTYAWNGSRWRKWDTPSWANASITRGSYIDSISCRYKFTNGICQVAGLVSPSQGVSGDWQFATINDTDLRSSLGIIPAAMRGSVVINGYLNTESGQLWLTSPGGLWGAYFSITYPVDLNK